MLIANKIENLINELNKLKPNLSVETDSSEEKFNELLKSALENSDVHNKKVDVAPNSLISHKTTQIPNWVKNDFYDPENPRKPNMRELMEAISGKDLETLYAENEESLQEISTQASDLLYGVIGSNTDTRDWLSIMKSENILGAVREQTGIMYRPKIDIVSNFDENDNLLEQTAVIKDNKGNTLRSLSNDTISAEEELLNFGATKESIPTNLEELINPEKFDNDLLTFLKNFYHYTTSVQQIVIRSATEAIANKISQEIPLDELAKL